MGRSTHDVDDYCLFVFNGNETVVDDDNGHTTPIVHIYLYLLLCVVSVVPTQRADIVE